MAGTQLYAWDDTNKEWVKVKTDDEGRLYTVAVIDELDDIGDVNVPAPADGEGLVWDDATNKWIAAEVGVTAHKDTHDPQDGSDPLDTAIAVKVGEANAIGTSHSLARADHVHEKHHAKYTDVAAVAAAKTVKLDDFTAPDDNTDLDAAAAKHGLMPKLDKVKLDTVDANADVTGSNPPQAHKLTHQNDGTDEISVAGLSGQLADDQHIVDAEAVSAMGAKADDNPLHHDRAVEWGATEHTAIGNDAPHHAKYTNAEAVAAVKADAGLPVLSITFIIDGGGSAITTGEKGHLEIPFACTIGKVTMLADQSGSIVVDIWKDTYANFPPTVADTITAAAKPTITTAQKSADADLTGWTTAIAVGNILAFNVDSCTDIERVTISLVVTKT